MAGPSDTEIIADLAEQFSDHCDTLSGLRVQSREAWLGQRQGNGEHGKWKSEVNMLYDDQLDMRVPHWMEIPYINETVTRDAEEFIAIARELKNKLSQNFAENNFDLAFTDSWGVFCKLIATLETLLSAKPETLATARTIDSGHTQDHIKAQRHWFSRLYLELQKDPDLTRRWLVEEAIVETINACIADDLGNADGFGRNWFKPLLGDPKKKLDHHLSSAFRDKKLSVTAIERIARDRSYAIPQVQGLRRLKSQ